MPNEKAAASAPSDETFPAINIKFPAENVESAAPRAMKFAFKLPAGPRKSIATFPVDVKESLPAAPTNAMFAAESVSSPAMMENVASLPFITNVL